MKLQSTPEITVRPAAIGDAAIIAASLREDDRRELEASTPLSPDRAIAESISLSMMCWTAEKNGKPIAVMGVTPISIIRGAGSPWMLGTSECDKSFVRFTALSRVYIPAMLSLFPTLENMVDVRNVKSIRWLKRLGFEFRDAIAHPYSGSLFYPFEMRAGNV